jgi:metal-responsive CopG/Arc/MetJ family transcriptional regulator
MASKTMKLTISLPRSLAVFADQMAKENHVTRSKIVSMCLAEERQRRKAELMKEGYLAMARQYSEFAESAEEIASEVLPAWK